MEDEHLEDSDPRLLLCPWRQTRVDERATARRGKKRGSAVTFRENTEKRGEGRVKKRLGGAIRRNRSKEKKKGRSEEKHKE